MRNCGKNLLMIVLYMFYILVGDKKLRLKVKKKWKNWIYYVDILMIWYKGYMYR